MNWKKTSLAMGVTALAFGLFWHIWYLATGSIPEVSELTLSDEKTWQLPFSISHSWDPFFSPLFILVLAWVRSRDYQEEPEGLFVGLFVGLFGGLGVLFGALFVGLVFGLGGLVYGLLPGLIFSVGYGIAFGFVIGTGWTMPVGIASGLFVTLPPFLILGFILVVRNLIRQGREQTGGDLPKSAS